MNFKRGENPHKKLRLGDYRSGGPIKLGSISNTNVDLYFDKHMDDNEIKFGRSDNRVFFCLIGEIILRNWDNYESDIKIMIAERLISEKTVLNGHN